MKTAFHFFGIIGATLLTMYLFMVNPYMHQISFKAEVMDKTIAIGQKGRERPMIRYKRLSDGNIFSTQVEPSDYIASKPQDVQTVHVRPFDVKRSKWEDFRYVGLPLVAALLTGVWIVIFLVIIPLFTEIDAQQKSGTPIRHRSSFE